MKGTHVLAIDEGTTGVTALIIDRGGAIKGRAYSEFPQHFPEPGWVEHDANEIWSATIKVIGAALDNAKIKPADLAAIGITNQRETSVMWHRSNGKPAANAIVWQDRRTALLCDELRSEGLEPVWQKKTGLLLDPYFSGTKVRWMLDHVKGLRSAAHEGDIAFGTIDSWLAWKLTGGACHITDVSNASRTMLYNISTLEWDSDILRRLGIPSSILPKVMPSSCVYGETDPGVFFGARIPIAGIAGDQQAALFGQACYEDGSAKNTYGTGSFLLMNIGNRPTLSKERLLTTIAWRIGDEPVQYALEGSIFITGAAVQWLRDGLGIIAHAAETEALARSVPDNGDVYFVPALTGLGAPHWDPYARGLIAGITRGTTRGHICRATLESICYQTRDVVEAMGRESGIPLKSLRADGGAVGNAFLMQFQSDILGVPVEVPGIAATTGLGAAYLAGLAVGFWKDKSEVARKRKVAQLFEPAMNDDERSRLYSRWNQAVKRSMGWAVHNLDSMGDRGMGETK